MKSRLLVISGLLCATAASGQQTTVQMECRELASSGNVLGPDESLVNGMACKTVKQTAKSPAAAQPSQSANAENFAPTTPSPAVAAKPETNTPETSPAPISLKIVPGSKVFIAPMDGFESYLAAAFGKKKVRLIPVATEATADYVISGTSLDKKAGWAKIVFMGNIHSDNAASITMTDRHSGAIVYAYAVDKKSTMHGQQTTAEACAKHLEAHIEGHN
jgi:hypothetical protein